MWYLFRKSIKYFWFKCFKHIVCNWNWIWNKFVEKIYASKYLYGVFICVIFSLFLYHTFADLYALRIKMNKLSLDSILLGANYLVIPNSNRREYINGKIKKQS